MSQPINSQRDVVFIVGIILFAITIIATFIIPFFFLMMPLLLVTASIFIAISEKKKTTKFWWILLPSCLLFLLIFVGYQRNKMESETYLIPSGFRGSFAVYFEESRGTDTEYRNGKRVYRIPQDGILITKFTRESGFIDNEFYLFDAEGNKTPLPKLDTRDFNFEGRLSKTEDEPPRDKLSVFPNMNFATLGAKSHGFIVTTYQDLKDKFGNEYYVEVEKKAEKKLRECREK